MKRYAIPGFSKLTAQQVFDMSAKHLLTQNKKSIASVATGACAYRGFDGLKCAAGVFLRDKNVRDCEQRGWGELVDSKMVPKANARLIGGLQRIHDYEKPEDWAGFLRQLAERFNLKYNAERYLKP